ncbi:MAG: sporulation membrane protein YtaF [Dethiobacter sp.]|nr:sporulation membrane protein YtaF [Dethiobacter sp.]MBS3897903.1 sporulation membrane protein YtaF [Dethiobacter sp.]MBS3982167.1 sporulation membrane protein YtaF [Dethiobacter sp.]MCL4463030.1 sporulation membrane protein YtaF [Bacillota bacterium]MCL5993400.1 sporulation membrane protein YtaF [Bacillota bacterium]
MSYIAVLMLGIAVSLDGFGVGFAYGLRRLHIPPASLLVICASSAFSVFISMVAGMTIVQLFSLEVGSVLGSVLLIGVGVFLVWQSLQKADMMALPNSREEQINEKGFSYLSGMLREPHRADFDKSGVITGKEAMVLGIALAMDAFGAGFGAAMLGFAPLTTALGVGVIKMILITAGLQLGRRYAQNISGEWAAVFAGLVLIFLGVIHLFSFM